MSAARVALLALWAAAPLLGCSAETRIRLFEPVLADAGSTGSAGNSGSAGSADSAGATGSPNLLHRYSFDGTGTVVTDSVGSADGVLQNGATLDGAGHVALDGVDDFVDLPKGLISGLKDATLIAWLSWNGGPCWQRVFDFGSSDAGEGKVGNATSSLFATPLRCPGTGPAVSYENATAGYGSVDSDAAFPVLFDSMLAVVVDVTGGELRLYAAGALLGTGSVASLSYLSDVNDWLGRSQWVQDIYLRGTYDEFRIYGRAFSTEELAAIEAAGPEVY